MKKEIIHLAIFVFVFTACKKDRTCTCETAIISQTSTQPGYTYTPPPATTTSHVYKKISQKNIYSQACVSSETKSTESYSTINGTVSVTYEITKISKSHCKLE